MSEKIYNMVDLETIEKLADIVAAKELGEITIADGEKYITVKGKKCPPPMPRRSSRTPSARTRKKNKPSALPGIKDSPWTPWTVPPRTDK